MMRTMLHHQTSTLKLRGVPCFITLSNLLFGGTHANYRNCKQRLRGLGELVGLAMTRRTLKIPEAFAHAHRSLVHKKHDAERWPSTASWRRLADRTCISSAKH
ncbi:hypothetical protein HBI56_194770 [Parastagonospora nodorum]|nr:hypothetical protein HBH52_191120 [Parastagonospora nodorum]KAH4157231.1 hypothetical protein HBH43_199730 [Parastagonospora nodorum]KAH4193874.1 hypothetical protein HBI95_202160 [Parastagonospora nodorum]KAH4291584.1 hypothetical protein HBI01_189940 [Parastagonospora nodorum]KAH4291984.1 hypothetical protein HBI02_192470 [Parastagonospora nodorum]